MWLILVLEWKFLAKSNLFILYRKFNLQKFSICERKMCRSPLIFSKGIKIKFELLFANKDKNILIVMEHCSTFEKLILLSYESLDILDIYEKSLIDSSYSRGSADTYLGTFLSREANFSKGNKNTFSYRIKSFLDSKIPMAKLVFFLLTELVKKNDKNKKKRSKFFRIMCVDDENKFQVVHSQTVS